MAEPNDPNPPPPPGLPPVVPPSGRYIAQLFIVPGLIVATAVGVLLLFSWMGSGAHTPAGFLNGLRNVNPEVRWRSASDLAQVLLRDDDLAADPEFGLELTTLLHQSLEPMKKDIPPASPSTAGQRREYKLQRSEVQYLAACLGHFSTPVGAKVLCEIAEKPLSPDAKTDALLRRQAVWALGELGYNRKRFEGLPAEKKEKAFAELDRLAKVPGERGEWARAAAESLRQPSSIGVIAALATCAKSEDPFLRKEAALALSFWDGSADESTLAEETLMRLTRDDGRGPRIAIANED